MISLIAAMSKNRVIGNNNSLIWKLPADMKRFKEITTGKTVIMGRKTYESIGRPLPNRRNIIITRNGSYSVDGCEVTSSLEKAIEISNGDAMIIGGGEIYTQALSIADKVHLTIIHEDFEGDTYFPEMGEEWVKVIREDHQPDEKNQHKYSFIDYEKYNF
jgi:dihydrofolate reductase